MALIVQDVKDYLGIDYDDPMTERRITRTMQVADTFLAGSLGEGYPKDDSRAEELTLMVISDLYDNHDMTDKVAGNVRRMVYDFSLQLRLEMRSDT